MGDIGREGPLEVIERVRVRMLPDGRMAREDAARYVGVKPKTLAQWQCDGKLRGVRLGGRVWYYRSDLDRLERAIKTWPAGGWHTAKIFQEYNLALTRGVAGGRFLRWFEQAN